MSSWIKWGAISVALLLLVSASLLVILTGAQSDAIHQGVYVSAPDSASVTKIDLGGLNRAEAEAYLRDQLPHPSEESITLRLNERAWRYSWAALGRGYDYTATAEAAHQVGRGGSWLEQQVAALRLRFDEQKVDPMIIPADPQRVQTAVQAIAVEIYREPQEAELYIDAEGVRGIPGKAGQEVDVEATVQALMDALARDLPEAEGVIVPLAPRLVQPEPAQTEARSLLAEPLIIDTSDPLTDYEGSLTAYPEQIATWLRTRADYDAEPPRMLLELNTSAVRSWLEEKAPQLGEERLLDVEETFSRTLTALEAGEHRAKARIRHPEGRYVVQAGDNFYDIAFNHGFPQWRLEEANPDVEPGTLLIGQELVIPSIDVLITEPIVPDKRIEINLPEQKLRAYEDEIQVFELTVSSGMSSTPTIAGQFQVLMKEPEAFAQRWSLEMPYFMGIYKEGPDFYNGIHELPINAGGYRLSAGVLGWPASFGCIILDEGDAQMLFDWAPIGTLVRIEGVAPGTPFGRETLDQIVDNPP